MSDEYSFVVTVDVPNESPELAYIGDKVAVANETLTFTVHVSDPDEDPLTFAADGLPSGATFVAGSVYGTAQFTWVPTIGYVGVHTVTLRVTDSGNGDSGLAASDEQTIQFGCAHIQLGAGARAGGNADGA